MRSFITSLALMLGIAAPLTVAAQQRDSVRAPATPPKPAAPPKRAAPQPFAPDSELHPPISPRNAFLSSLALPGLGQTRLSRPNAAAFFIGIEAFSIAMARKSSNDLHEARLYQNRVQIGDYTLNSGAVVLDTITGLPTGTPIYSRLGGVGDTLVKARRTHYEDWIAAILFNHLISGADAYVAAHLWDLPTQVKLRALPRGASFGATVWW